MATTRMAIGALLGTIQTSAEVVGDIFSSVGTGAKMINDFATNARDNQLTNIKLSKVGYLDQLMTTKTVEIAQSQRVLKDYILANPDQEEATQKIWESLKEALA